MRDTRNPFKLRRAENIDTPLQRPLDMLQVVEAPGPDQINDEMGSGSPNAWALDEEGLAVFVAVRVRYEVRGITMIFLLGGA